MQGRETEQTKGWIKTRAGVSPCMDPGGVCPLQLRVVKHLNRCHLSSVVEAKCVEFSAVSSPSNIVPGI